MLPLFSSSFQLSFQPVFPASLAISFQTSSCHLGSIHHFLIGGPPEKHIYQVSTNIHRQKNNQQQAKVNNSCKNTLKKKSSTSDAASVDSGYDIHNA